MPTNKHLTWTDITDFTPGLFTTSDWLIPPSGAQQMDDVIPEVGKGMRAGMRAITHSVAGIANPTTVVVAGVFIRGGIGPVAQNTDRYLWLRDGTNLKVYRWDETTAPVAWTLLTTIALGGTTLNSIVADTFVDSTGAEYVMFNVFQSAANDGCYSINRATGVVTNRLALPITCVVVQDDRIIAANGATLRWSDSQSVSSFPAPNNLPIQKSRQGAIIVAMNAFAPSDLLLGQGFAPWVLVQGDITNPTVRGMNNARFPGNIQRTPLTKGGVAFMGYSQGVFLTTDGNTFTDISTQLARSSWGPAPGAAIGYSEDILFACNGVGMLVWDERTQGWSRTSALGTLPAGAAGDPKSNEMFAVGFVGGTLVAYTFKTDLSNRAGTWTWKSANFHLPSGRQIEIREVQVYARNYDAGATITVTVNGTSHTVTPAAPSKQLHQFLFKERSEVLDVTITATAGSPSTIEAPSVEVVRIGTGLGHQLL